MKPKWRKFLQVHRLYKKVTWVGCLEWSPVHSVIIKRMRLQDLGCVNGLLGASKRQKFWVIPRQSPPTKIHEQHPSPLPTLTYGASKRNQRLWTPTKSKNPLDWARGIDLIKLYSTCYLTTHEIEEQSHHHRHVHHVFAKLTEHRDFFPSNPSIGLEHPLTPLCSIFSGRFEPFDFKRHPKILDYDLS